MRKPAFVLVFVAAAFAACAGQPGPPGGFDSGPGFDGGDGSGGSGGARDSGHTDAPHHNDAISFDGPMADGTCAIASYSAQTAPSAMLFVLDASGSMGGSAGTGGSTKWAEAQQAIVTAMDLPVFDTISLGLLTYPQVAKVKAVCPYLLGLGVNCAISGLPQVPLTVAGMDTTNATGVRHEIYDTLVASNPTAGPGNGNPVYDALQTGIAALQGFTTTKRLLFFITDGGASCTSQDTPQRPFYLDPNKCMDWEDPDNIVTMLKNAHDATTAPVNTLVVGVKGADNTDPNDNPPYRIRRALSAYALAGSPETVPAGCDGVYTQAGADPVTPTPGPCHFDLSTTPSFGTTLAADIATIRDQLLGCTYALPTPKSGTIDMNKVNVQYSLGGDGGAPTEIYKRASASDMCMTGSGCWDYNSSGDVQLIGNACTMVQMSTSANVQILVGCETIVK
jgi:hypothetical protein